MNSWRTFFEENTSTLSGTISGTATGGGGSHNNMQPSSFWNVMVKL